MTTKQYDAYSDLITFTRASTGTALRHIGYGAELVTNGTFDDGTTGFGAIGGASISYSAGEDALEVNVTGSGGGFAETQTLATTIGKVYLVSITVKKTTFSGNIHWNIDGVNYGSFTPTTEYQTFSKPFVATDASLDVGFPRESSPTGIYFVREVSVKEVIFDRATDPLVLFNHPTNVPRIEYDANGNRKGLLIEEARTNSIRNSVAGGAVVGSPGSLPTYWAVFGGTAATEIVATGTEAGVAYVDVRITGNPATGIFNFESSTQISASEGESWSLNLNARIVAGDTTNVNELSPSINWRSSGAFLSRVTGEDFKDETNAGPRIVSGTAPATTDRVLPQIFVSCSGDVDFTLRVYAPQLEAGSFPTSYISTSGAAASRSADVASIPTSAFGYNQKAGTVVAEMNHPLANRAGSRKYVWNIKDSGNDRLSVRASDGVNSILEPRAVVGNGVSTIDFVSPVTTAASYKVALSYNDVDATMSVNGVLAAQSAAYAGNPQTTLALAQSGTGGSQPNGYLKSIQYYPRRLSNAQLQELTS